MKTIITNATLVTARGPGVLVLEDQAIVIEGGVIRTVCGSEDGAAAPADSPSEVIDARNHLVIPGLINTHHHLYQSLTRGLTSVQNAALFDWLVKLYQKWRHIDHQAVKTAALVSMGEMLLSGCTTTSDHFYIFPQGSKVRIEAVLEAAELIGMRIHACRGSMSVGESRGGLPPDDCTEPEDVILADCARVIEAYHDPDPHAMVRIDLAPCSPFNVSPELLRDTRVLAGERGVLLHTHAAETLDEERYCLERFGLRPIPFLHEHGWLGPDVYLAHCVHLDDADIDLLAQTGTGVAHCPCSNMRLGSGIARIERMLARGVKVGIGLDGSSSNDGGNVLAEVRQALLLQRVCGGATALATQQAFRIATVGGANVLGRSKLGRIEPGMAADLAMYRKDDLAFAGAIAQDPLAALTLCHAPRADRVMVNGRTVVKDGRLAMMDEHKLAHDLNTIVRERFR
ncbi:MAG: 8-oxoguanine deaminase [bacterium]|nr:8-oxoguanine deaminase [bacterium]